MLWFAVWFLLVTGSLVGGFFLVRHVYRSGRALLAALEELSGVLERLDARVAALADTVGTTPAPVELEDPEPARARTAAARARTAARRRRRTERHEEAYRRWWAFVR